MRFLFHYPETSGTGDHMLEPGAIPDVAAHAEAAGFDGFSLTEHPVPGVRWLEHGGHQSLDPFVALAAAAARTTRLRLLTHLAVAPYRNPFLLAKAAATVDLISNGRMTLGLGAGYHGTEFRGLGVDMAERNELFDEALEVLPLHWSGEPFSYTGRHFDAREVIARPRPVQVPIPIWIGGNSRISLRRVAERAQGWMPMLGPAQLSQTARTRHIESVSQLAEMIQELAGRATEAGRSGRLDVLCSYSDSMLARTPRQDPDRHREAFAEMERIGVTWLVISCRSRTEGDTFRFLDAFGETYLG